MDIEIDYVLSVSSEDESSPASNLTMGRRWTVAEKGISEATVDLKFKKSSIIKSISIGRVGFDPIFVSFLGRFYKYFFRNSSYSGIHGLVDPN